MPNKDLIHSLYWDALSNIRNMELSKMKISDRIRWEKAIVQLEIMKKLIDKQP